MLNLEACNEMALIVKVHENKTAMNIILSRRIEKYFIISLATYHSFSNYKIILSDENHSVTPVISHLKNEWL